MTTATATIMATATVVQQRWQSPLGEILLRANDTALLGVWFHNQKYVPDDFETTDDSSASSVIQQTIAWLEGYFKAEAPSHDLVPLSPVGTDFQQSVWQALLKVPTGVTMTYGELAHSLNSPKAVRAVAAAVGKNPISVLIPCHRIVGSNGSLTGYAGGLDRKQHLLALESGQRTWL